MTTLRSGQFAIAAAVIVTLFYASIEPVHG
jgi:hypothetical protein